MTGAAAVEGARQRNPLPLPDAEVGAALEPGAQQGIVAVRQARDRRIGPGRDRRGLDLRP